MSLPKKVLDGYEPKKKMTINGFKSGSLDINQAFKFAFNS